MAWADPVAAMHGAAAMLAALIDREAHPQHLGQAIELAQLEGMICFIGPQVMEAQYAGRAPTPPGNRHPYQAPQGCYPCAGDDRWIAITVTNDEEWLALCRLAGFNQALSDLTLDQRFALHDEIDVKIAAWTSAQVRDDLQALLQDHGIAACSVNDARDVVENAHLASRHFFPEIEHTDAGRYRFPGQPIQMSATPASYRLPSPGLGEHNREILVGMLGLTDDDIIRLTEAKVIAEEPPG